MILMKTFLKKILFISRIFLIILLIIAIVITIKIKKDLPNIDKILELDSKNEQVIKLFYNDNSTVIRTYNNKDNNDVNYNEISKNVINALISTEDKRFFKHKGIDLFGILRATIINIKNKQFVQGGSTITQQLSKMIIGNNEKTLFRKYKEMFLAFRLEKFFTKEEILTMYLNRAYFGAGKYGIKSASEFYFNKIPQDLTVEEAAMLIGLLKAPAKFSPTNSEDLAKKRALQVIINMQNNGFIESKEVFDYIIPDINYDYKEINKNSQKYYFTDWVNKKLENINIMMQNQHKINVETTLDDNIQEKVEDVLYSFIAKNNEKIQKTEIAIVVMNKNGEVLSMIGGKSYDKSPFNRALYAYRQTGSLFKTIVFLTAFEKGLTIHDKFIDEPIAVKNWYPENFGKKYYGEVTVETAFNKSLNSVAVQISNYFGLNNIIETARKLGISSNFNKNDLTIVLGSANTTLLEMTKAYSIINNWGNDTDYKCIKTIYNDDEKVIFRTKNTNNKNNKEALFSESSIRQMKRILYTTVLNGTAKNAKIDKLVNKTEAYNTLNQGNEDYFIGGKTGSSQNGRDAWFIGFANDLTIGIWFGNDDNTPTNNLMGGNLPAILWKNIVEEIIK